MPTRSKKTPAPTRPTRDPDPALMDAHRMQFEQFKRERSNDAVRASLDALARAANGDGGNIFGRVVEAADVSATQPARCACCGVNSASGVRCRWSEAWAHTSLPRRRRRPPTRPPRCCVRWNRATAWRSRGRSARSRTSCPARRRSRVNCRCAVVARTRTGHHRCARRGQVDAGRVAARRAAAPRPACSDSRGRSIQPDHRRRGAGRPGAHGRVRRARKRLHPFDCVSRPPGRPVTRERGHHRPVRPGRLRHGDRRDGGRRAVGGGSRFRSPTPPWS